MGWGVTDYPQARECGSFFCEEYTCRFETKDDSELAECQHPGCKLMLCDGCVFECGDCKEMFCKRHIVELPLPDHTHMGHYQCVTCNAEGREKAA